MSDPKVLKRLALKVKDGEYVEIFLREGTRENNNFACYISLTLYLNGKKYTINMNKEKTSLLSYMIHELLNEAINHDYERLVLAYPNQNSWHVY